MCSCPNPYCDGTGWILAGTTATSRAYRVPLCKVGPHTKENPPMPEPGQTHFVGDDCFPSHRQISAEDIMRTSTVIGTDEEGRTIMHSPLLGEAQAEAATNLARAEHDRAAMAALDNPPPGLTLEFNEADLDPSALPGPADEQIALRFFHGPLATGTVPIVVLLRTFARGTWPPPLALRQPNQPGHYERGMFSKLNMPTAYVMRGAEYRWVSDDSPA